MYNVHCKNIMISQFSDLILSHTYLFYPLKVIGHFTLIIILFHTTSRYELNNSLIKQGTLPPP